METADIQEIRNVSDPQKGARIMKMDLIDDAGVNLQCVNSSDFMVGKQTNFNGPVTIINYEEGTEMPWKRSTNSEEVIIKERILAPSLAASMENFVKEKVVKEIPQAKILGKKHEESLAKRFCNMKYLKLPILVWSFILLLVACSCVILILTLIEADERKVRCYITVNNKSYELVTRKEWGALPPEYENKLNLPVPYVVIAHSATSTCYTEATCCKLVKNMQAQNMDERGFPDLKYNFLVGSDGRIYESRGWHVKNENPGEVASRNLDFSFIGNHVLYEPTPEQTEAVRALVDYAREMNYITENYTLLPARAILNTRSPGRFVVNIIEKWPHYKQTLNNSNIDE